MYVYDGIKDTSALVDWSNYNILTGFSLDYIWTPTSYIRHSAGSSTDNMMMNMTLICVIHRNWIFVFFNQKEAARKIQPGLWTNQFCIFNGKNLCGTRKRLSNKLLSSQFKKSGSFEKAEILNAVFQQMTFQQELLTYLFQFFQFLFFYMKGKERVGTSCDEKVSKIDQWSWIMASDL